jgi:hypothetical protein
MCVRMCVRADAHINIITRECSASADNRVVFITGVCLCVLVFVFVLCLFV